MRLPFNIMNGLEKVTKRDFCRIYREKFPKRKEKDLAKELTDVNRDYKIVLYHNQGFLFDWGELKFGGVNWGRFISSFNINSPKEMITVGGNYVERYHGGIHPNIYVKPTTILRDIYYGNSCRVCLYGRQIEAIDIAWKDGRIFDILSVIKAMFDNNEAGDGLWYNFNHKRCSTCDDIMINVEGDLCKSCSAL